MRSVYFYYVIESKAKILPYNHQRTKGHETRPSGNPERYGLAL